MPRMPEVNNIPRRIFYVQLLYINAQCTEDGSVCIQQRSAVSSRFLHDALATIVTLEHFLMGINVYVPVFTLCLIRPMRNKFEFLKLLNCIKKAREH